MARRCKYGKLKCARGRQRCRKTPKGGRVVRRGRRGGPKCKRFGFLKHPRKGRVCRTRRPSRRSRR